MLTDILLFDIVVIQWTSLNYVSACFFLPGALKMLIWAIAFKLKLHLAIKELCVLFTAHHLFPLSFYISISAPHPSVDSSRLSCPRGHHSVTGD